MTAQSFTQQEAISWSRQASQVTVIRDNWGIPHIYGKTDANAVFGLLYAQCEDDFKRVEMNYIEKLGRMAEVKGESELYNDLLIRLLIDSTEAIADYSKAEPWLRKLLDAYADGINYYLYKNPNVKPVLLYRFKPWFPLLWTDGSIGAISTADVTTEELKAFYNGNNELAAIIKKEPDLQDGSNGFAIGPSKRQMVTLFCILILIQVFISDQRCKCKARKVYKFMALLHGDSFLCTRDLMSTVAGCILQVLLMLLIFIKKKL